MLLKWFPVVPLALVLLLAACGNNESASSAENSGTQSLCVSSNCGASTTLAFIPDAENILFTDDGRLFVTGDEVYEITRNGEAFTATALGAPGCNGSAGFLGLAQRGNVIYSPCNTDTPQLYAATLAANPQLVPIHSLTGTTLPNGVATDNQGRMYIVNGPLAQPPKIIRLIFDPNDPLHVISQENWLTTGLESPNGITFDGENFYITDTNAAGLQLGVVKRIGLNADGSAGPVETIYSQLSLLDDLSVAGPNSLLLADFVLGKIIQIDKSGRLIAQT